MVTYMWKQIPKTTKQLTKAAWWIQWLAFFNVISNIRIGQMLIKMPLQNPFTNEK